MAQDDPWFDQFTQPAPNYQQDYWAQDRPQVLASQGLTDTSGKTWNGTTWTAPAAAGQSGQVTMQQFNDAWLNSPYPGTVDGLKQFMAAHPEYAQAGITLGGSKGDKVYGPGGAYWGDAVVSAGLGGRGKSGLSGDTGGSIGGVGTGSLVSPIGQFTPPTAEDALNSPGVQFALQEANRIGQNNAAARGTLLNGRFQQALGASNIQNALGAYGDVYNRAANTYGINFNTQTRNQDAPYQKFLSLADLGQRAAGAS